MFLQIPNSRLPAVGLDERVQGVRGEIQLFLGKAAVFQRCWHQVLLSYRQFLLCYVTCEKIIKTSAITF